MCCCCCGKWSSPQNPSLHPLWFCSVFKHCWGNWSQRWITWNATCILCITFLCSLCRMPKAGNVHKGTVAPPSQRASRFAVLEKLIKWLIVDWASDVLDVFKWNAWFKMSVNFSWSGRIDFIIDITQLKQTNDWRVISVSSMTYFSSHKCFLMPICSLLTGLIVT